MRSVRSAAAQRSTTPAYYALPIKPKKLNSRLSAAGSFAVAKSGGVAGVFFGFFNADQPGGSGSPIGSTDTGEQMVKIYIDGLICVAAKP